MFRINDRVIIPYEDIRFITSRSSGPGGQHVNTTDSRVTLLFDVDNSSSLTELNKSALRNKLGRRMNKLGVLQVTSQRHRSQKANKDAAIERFVELLQWALTPAVKRRKTRIPRSAKRKRLENKKRTSQRKRNRSMPDFSGEY